MPNPDDPAQQSQRNEAERKWLDAMSLLIGPQSAHLSLELQAQWQKNYEELRRLLRLNPPGNLVSGAAEIAALEAKGFILRRIDPDDARSFHLVLRPQGKKCAMQVIRTFDRMQKDFEKRIGAAERQIEPRADAREVAPHVAAFRRIEIERRGLPALRLEQRPEHERPPAQRDAGNRNARRIPDQDFRTNFGREHAFRVARRDDRRFNYGGYWFVYSQPWPAGWSYDDDVYVDDIDGEYYLIDPIHPGIRLLVIVAS